MCRHTAHYLHILLTVLTRSCLISEWTQCSVGEQLKDEQLHLEPFDEQLSKQPQARLVAGLGQSRAICLYTSAATVGATVCFGNTYVNCS